MAKRPSVLSFLCCIGAASEDIPVTVKEGPRNRKEPAVAGASRVPRSFGSPPGVCNHREAGNHSSNPAQRLQHQEAVNRRCNGGQVRKELTKCLFSEPPTEPAMQGLSAT